MGPELRVRRTGGENRVNYAEIIEDLECARLDALATRPLEGRCCGVDQTKRDPAAREIERERQPRRSGSDNQYSCFRTSYDILFNGTMYECQSENRG